MPQTYEPIATTTLGSANSTITFSSISSAYTDIDFVLVSAGGGLTTGLDFIVRFNGDTATNYSTTTIQARSDSSLTASSDTSYASIRINKSYGFNNIQPAVVTGTIFSYSKTSVFKTVLCRGGSDNNTSNQGTLQCTTGTWRSTSAINSISFINDSQFRAGTTVTIYGITKA